MANYKRAVPTARTTSEPATNVPAPIWDRLSEPQREVARKAAESWRWQGVPENHFRVSLPPDHDPNYDGNAETALRAHAHKLADMDEWAGRIWGGIVGDTELPDRGKSKSGRAFSALNAPQQAECLSGVVRALLDADLYAEFIAEAERDRADHPARWAKVLHERVDPKVRIAMLEAQVAALQGLKA
ncbi:MAG: hypothetical protein L3K16_06640 [Thermoplasmata archaeon]|nr:hypothetical protein [Thermoplasmata archaeon]